MKISTNLPIKETSTNLPSLSTRCICQPSRALWGFHAGIAKEEKEREDCAREGEQNEHKSSFDSLDSNAGKSHTIHTRALQTCCLYCQLLDCYFTTFDAECLSVLIAVVVLP